MTQREELAARMRMATPKKTTAGLWACLPPTREQAEHCADIALAYIREVLKREKVALILHQHWCGTDIPLKVCAMNERDYRLADAILALLEPPKDA